MTLLAALASLAPIACGPASRERASESAAPDTSRPSERVDTAATPSAAGRVPGVDSLSMPPFEYFALLDPASLVELQHTWGDSGLSTILKLNRIDLDHARAGDTLVVPRAPRLFLEWSPFPRDLLAARAVTQLLLVSARIQAFAAYDSGRLVRWGPVSSGRREMPTPHALYHANWKARTHVSTVDEAWILNWYVNLDNFGGISLHQYDLPGRPASHWCVRLHEDDAQWLYGWVRTWKVAPDGRQVLEKGTPVVVFGEYRWFAVRPWKRLVEEPAATDVIGAEILGALRKSAVPGVTPVSAASPQTAGAPDPERIEGP